MRKGPALVCLICLAVLLTAYVAGQGAVRKMRQGLLVRYAAPQSLLSGRLAHLVAGEFKGLVADYLLLEAGSFIGSNQEATPDDWHNIYLALKQSLSLDPYFQQSYIYAQGNLPWAAKMADETIELLSITIAHRFWDWRPGYYAGFDYYYFFNDYAKAADSFLEAAKIKNAPVLLAILGGRMAMKGQKIENAIILLQTMIDNQQLKDDQLKEVQWRIEALKGVQTLEKAIDRYRNSFHANPGSLEQLVEKGVIQALPENPYGQAYLYDSQTGRVAFDKVK